MTLLRAIPFSFNVLWRLALVFPFMILAIIVFGIIATVFVVIAAFIAPLAALIMGVAFGVATSVLPVIVGARLGLQAKQSSMRNTYFGLMLPAVGYGLFEAFCVLLIFLLGAGVYLVATPLSLEDLAQFTMMDQEVLMAQLLSVNPAITLSIFWVGGVLIVALRAALLMPFAGASIGSDPGGRAHTPFYGFGSEFISLLILVAISYILSSFTVPIVLAICYMLGFGDALETAIAQINANASPAAVSLLGTETGIFIGLCVVFYIWAIALQSAGGVLAYMKQAEDFSDQQNAFDMSMDAHLETMTNAQPVERPMQSEDVMELIRSRMQQNKR
ncbi:hypothetical protein BC777_0024 [Yoonia maricola]|uniref:Uncharacterized protein n=1 Tax=Yoonia maricola TaxID=420999 RepID=A0A2M8WJU1_9RHOB|nr:hypothetical protein [Yoonia maricola]PJI91200.1 hypothetical protein BC777_0024 [Yoonia maricola]